MFMLFYPVQVTLVLMAGLVTGSFLNACIYRLPRGISMVFPPSHCPKCGENLRWHDLVPLFSYLFLRGRCSSCKNPIPLRYLLVEIITPLLFFSLLQGSGFNAGLIFAMVFVSALILATFSDLETQIIPDAVPIAGSVAGFILAFIGNRVADSLIGFAAGGVIMYAVFLLGKLIYKKDALGGGDIKLAMMMGAFLGWKGLLLAIFLSYITGAIVSLALLSIKAKTMESEIPFGPFMCLGALIALFYGGPVIALYLRLL